jgi:hypothetical protein
VSEPEPSDIPPLDTLDLAIQALLAAVPHIGGPLQVFAEWERQKFWQRNRELEASVLEATTAQCLAEVLQDDRRARSIVRAATIHGLSDWEAKRRALSDVVVAVIEGDDAELDSAELLVDALADLDRPHIALLVRIYEEQEATGETVRIYYLDPEPHPSAVSGLIRHGLISSEGTGLTLGGVTRCSVTSFGEDLLRLLGHEIAESEPYDDVDLEDLEP